MKSENRAGWGCSKMDILGGGRGIFDTRPHAVAGTSLRGHKFTICDLRLTSFEEKRRAVQDRFL